MMAYRDWEIMKQVIKPMLATEVDFNKLRYPVYTQPKLDGIRVIVTGKQIGRAHV